jgi:hypothetical protein
VTQRSPIVVANIQRRQERSQKETGKIHQGKEEGKAGKEVEIG